MVTGGLLTPSKGTIEGFIMAFADSIDDDISAIKETLLNGLVINIDDTPMRCAETYEYKEDGSKILRTAENSTFKVNIRTYSNEKATYYTIISHRPWAKSFRVFLREMNAHKKSDQLSGIEECQKSLLESYSERYDNLIRIGEIALAKIEPGTFGYDELRKMMARLRDYKDTYLLFIRNYNAPFTNNLAEGDLRPCKTRQKISGCFRTWKGISNLVKTMSVFSTWKKEHADLFAKIKEKFTEAHLTFNIPWVITTPRIIFFLG